MENIAEVEAYIANTRGSITQYKQELDAIRSLDRPVTKNDPFVISFVGKFKTGKSSLINALLGMEILPTKATTCTSVITRIFRGRKLRAWCCENGSRQEISLDTAKKIIQDYQVEDPDNPVQIIIEVPVPWLSYGVELRDTPGMDDSAQNGHLETIAMNAPQDTDLCICVYDASSMISSKERERTRFIHENMGGNAVHIVNRINLLNSKAQLQEIEQLSNSFFGGLPSQENSVDGTGSFYTVCSAPGMVDLDRFDVWLKRIISGKRTFWKKLMEWLFRKMIMTPEKGLMRKNSYAGKLKYKTEQIKNLASLQMTVLKDMLAAQKQIHSQRKEQLIEEGKQLGIAEAKKIRAALPNAVSDLKTLQGLDEKLEACINELKGQKPFKWKDLCAQTTKSCVQDFFISNWKTYCESGKQPAIGTIDPKFISEAMEPLTFPGYAYISKWGGLRRIDDTVPTAMQYVRNMVLPVLEQQLTESVAEVVAREKEAIITQAAQTPTGMENIISEIESVQRKLKDYL